MGMIEALTETRTEAQRTAEIKQVFTGVQGFIGITAVHGNEPFLIVTETIRAINDIFESSSVGRKPVILPDTEKYRKALDTILPDEYGDTAQRSKILADIYFSKDLGDILNQTQFTMAGYQPHLESVAASQPQTQEALWRLLDTSFTAQRFTDGQELKMDPNQRLIEINAGANVTAAKNGEHTAYSIFPVTFEALLRMIIEHNNGEIFDYRRELLDANLAIAQGLLSRTRLVMLPFLHTLLEEPQLTKELYERAVFYPPQKDIQDPPTNIQFDFDGRRIIVGDKEKEYKTFPFNPEKGAVYVNVSGGGMGLTEAYTSVLTIKSQGYAIFAPNFVVKDWTRAGLDTSFVITAGPSVLYAKDKEGMQIFKGILMRSGKGITDRAELSETAMILNQYSRGDNPEIWGNDRAILNHNLGRRYSARADLIDLVVAGNHPEAIRRFKDENRKIYKIPEGVSGPQYVAEQIIDAEINASKG